MNSAILITYNEGDVIREALALCDSAGYNVCLLYTSDAADDTPCVDLGGRRII